MKSCRLCKLMSGKSGMRSCGNIEETRGKDNKGGNLFECSMEPPCARVVLQDIHSPYPGV